MHSSSDRSALEALQKLEYRGYDSFGFVSNSNVPTKFLGAISKQNLCKSIDPTSRCTIAHTRWATHGVVSLENTHPHQSYSKAFSVVHNGVITNFKFLRALLDRKHIPANISQTDTEVIAHMLEYLHTSKKDYSSLADLVLDVCDLLEGEFAICVTSPLWENTLVCARKNSPLVVALNASEAMVASDECALPEQFSQSIDIPNKSVLQLTSYLGYIDPIILLKNQPPIRDFSKLFKSIVRDLDSTLDESKYDSFMLKEMSDIPNNLEALAQRDFRDIAETLSRQRLILIGCGSAYYAAQLGHIMRNTSSRDGFADSFSFQADELPSMYKTRLSDTLICISQSGETYDTLEPAKEHIAIGGDVVSITNGKASSLAKLSTQTIHQDIGVERCVLATKSVVSQCAIMYQLFSSEGKNLSDFADVWRRCFDGQLLSSILDIAKICMRFDNFFFIGRGILLPVAMENALKLKEVTYCHAEGMGGGFFKHGTLSLIDDRFVTFAHQPNPEFDPLGYSLIEANISEIKARNGRVIRIGHTRDSDIVLPSISVHLDAMLHLGFGQYLAYFFARVLGRDIDRPRSLAKSVTVR